MKPMHGFRRLSALLCPLPLIALASCSGLNGERPPAAGTVPTSDPEASALFAEAKAAEQSGNTKKAIKAYKGM